MDGDFLFWGLGLVLAVWWIVGVGDYARYLKGKR